MGLRGIVSPTSEHKQQQGVAVFSPTPLYLVISFPTSLPLHLALLLISFPWVPLLHIILVMAFTLYDATIVEAKLALAALDHIITQAEKLPNADTFLQARLYEDMYPLTFQIHTATRFSELVLARLSGREAIQYENDLASYADMHARIAKVQEALGKADKDTVNRLGEEVAPTQLPSAGTKDITGKAFAMGAGMPNVNFHVTTAYAILRKEGVPLGKMDYIMSFVNEHILKSE